MSYRIAILDDEELVREGLALKLPMTGKELEIVYEEENGWRALEFLQHAHEQPVDIFFVDIVMPALDGLDFVRRAQRIWPDIRFVIVSGHDEFDYAKTAIKLGVQDYLLKPVLSGELSRTLEKIDSELRERRSRDEEKRVSELSIWLSSKGQARLSEESTAWLHQRLPAADQVYVLLAGNMHSGYQALPGPFDPAELAVPLLVGSYGSMWVCACRSALLADQLRQQPLIPKTMTVVHLSGIRTPEQLAAAAAAGMDWIQDHLQLGKVQVHKLEMTQTGREVAHSLNEEAAQALGLLKREQRFEQGLELLTALLESRAPQRYKEQGVRYFAETMLQTEVSLEWLQTFDDPEMFARQSLQLMQGGRSKPLAQSGKDIVQAIIASLEREYGFKKTLQDYADEYSIHPNHLARLFRQETDRTFLAFVTEYRMEQAAKKLLQTSHSIGQIAVECGYEDARYFSQVFRRHFRQTPSEFRARD